MVIWEWLPGHRQTLPIHMHRMELARFYYNSIFSVLRVTKWSFQRFSTSSLPIFDIMSFQKVFFLYFSPCVYVCMCQFVGVCICMWVPPEAWRGRWFPGAGIQVGVSHLTWMLRVDSLPEWVVYALDSKSSLSLQKFWKSRYQGGNEAISHGFLCALMLRIFECAQLAIYISSSEKDLFK